MRLRYGMTTWAEIHAANKELQVRVKELDELIECEQCDKKASGYTVCPSCWNELGARVKVLEAENDELKDFCIWMTGCGYVFTQHKYFCEQRDKLLKDSKREDESFLNEEVKIASLPDDYCYQCKSTSCKCEEEQR